MKILLAYGSAMARIDDMKLLGGVSGGRTGREILNTADTILRENEEFRLKVLTNPWIGKHSVLGSRTTSVIDKNVPMSTCHTFRTWEEYQELLYKHCDEWKPDIVLCATAVSNYTPEGIVEHRSLYKSPPPKFHVGSIKGKVDSRLTDRLTVHLVRTPNIISRVREQIGRDAVLVGFKLTSHGDLDKLIEHARHVLATAHCDFVVANDLKLGLNRKFFVTSTGFIEKEAADILPFAWNIRKAHIGGFYRTSLETPEHMYDGSAKDPDNPWSKAQTLYEHLKPDFTKSIDKHGDTILHGCLAVRYDPGFATTRRGKRPNEGCLTYARVEHDERAVYATRTKATLNAPLLDKIFKAHPDVKVIVHLHEYLKDVPTFPYQPPGSFFETVMADERVGSPRAFNIEAHGSIATFTTDDVDEILAWIDDEEHWA